MSQSTQATAPLAAATAAAPASFTDQCEHFTGFGIRLICHYTLIWEITSPDHQPALMIKSYFSHYKTILITA